MVFVILMVSRVRTSSVLKIEYVGAYGVFIDQAFWTLGMKPYNQHTLHHISIYLLYAYFDEMEYVSEIAWNIEKCKKW